MTRQFLRMMFAGLFCLALLPPSTFAQGQGHGHGNQKHQDQDDDDDRDNERNNDRDHDRHQDREHGPQHRVTIVFSSRDRDIVRDYYSDRYSNLPPGLAKRNGNLPPGLQKHLERGGTLPPGLQKRLTPFPEDLEARLPRLPSIYRRATIGMDVVILDRRTERIVDVIHDILRP